MSNPKVFEFAKEVGMTPLALMDKIKEWQFPIKNHMAEIEPEVLEQIKSKLSVPATAQTDEKPKKAAARKPAVKKEMSGPTIVTSNSVKKAAAIKAAADAAAVVEAPSVDKGQIGQAVHNLITARPHESA